VFGRQFWQYTPIALLDELQTPGKSLDRQIDPPTSLHLRTIRKLNLDYWRVGAWLAVSISADRQGFIGKRPEFEAPLSAKIIANGGWGRPNSEYLFMRSVEISGPCA